MQAVAFCMWHLILAAGDLILLEQQVPFTNGLKRAFWCFVQPSATCLPLMGRACPSKSASKPVASVSPALCDGAA